MSNKSTPTCDPNEAPSGYYAVPKPIWTDFTGNLCKKCDWRKACQDPATDLLVFGHRCMSAPVVASRDGKTYQRADKTSVLFKRRKP